MKKRDEFNKKVESAVLWFMIGFVSCGIIIVLIRG